MHKARSEGDLHLQQMQSKNTTRQSPVLQELTRDIPTELAYHFDCHDAHRNNPILDIYILGTKHSCTSPHSIEIETDPQSDKCYDLN